MTKGLLWLCPREIACSRPDSLVAQWNQEEGPSYDASKSSPSVLHLQQGEPPAGVCVLKH